MSARAELSKTIDQAFGVARLFTGNDDRAQEVVLDAIRALEDGDEAATSLLGETLKSGVRWRAEFPAQAERAFALLPRNYNR